MRAGPARTMAVWRVGDMPAKPKPPLELAARALCRFRGLPENTKFEGRPMWESFVPEARAVLEAVGFGGNSVMRREK